jgi:flavorubredoxin
MKAVEIKKGVYWVGAIDWNLRNFHGYLTQRGSTYNAYLIIDEKVTLIDTVKSYFVDEMIERISSIIDPSKIDYIISNHVEMDHSGALPKILKVAKNAKVFASPNGIAGLKAHYKEEWNFEAIKSGDTINLGKRSLQFILTPMIHWPDNMIGFMPEENILFSNDALGQHLASSERFDDEYPIDIVMEEARKYYANIVLPYGVQVKKALSQVADLDIKMIAPSHGVIWRGHIPEIIEEYKKWASNKVDKKAVIAYDTMWGSTLQMAEAIASAFEEKGYSYVLHNVSLTHISDIMTEIMTAEYICVGSPTLNNGMMPSTAAFLTYLEGLSPKNRKAVAFGSFGWGGQSIGQVEKVLKDAGMDVIYTSKEKYIPSKEALDKITKEVKELI